MKKTELHLELLLGRQVRGLNGKPIGRIEEIRTERRGRKVLIKEYHIGAYAMLERLSASTIGRLILKKLRTPRKSYRIPWDKLDVADYAPRLLCGVNELEPLDEGQ